MRSTPESSSRPRAGAVMARSLLGFVAGAVRYALRPAPDPDCRVVWGSFACAAALVVDLAAPVRGRPFEAWLRRLNRATDDVGRWAGAG